MPFHYLAILPVVVAIREFVFLHTTQTSGKYSIAMNWITENLAKSESKTDSSDIPSDKKSDSNKLPIHEFSRTTYVCSVGCVTQTVC